MHNLIHFHRYILILFLKGLTTLYCLVGVGKTAYTICLSNCLFVSIQILRANWTRHKTLLCEKRLGIYCSHQQISFTEIAYFFLAHVWLCFSYLFSSIMTVKSLGCMKNCFLQVCWCKLFLSLEHYQPVIET